MSGRTDLEDRGGNSKQAVILLPGLLLLLAAIYGYLFQQAPLPNRYEHPGQLDAPPCLSELPATHARLWEDPLEAAKRHQSRQEPSDDDGRFARLLAPLLDWGDSSRISRDPGKPFHTIFQSHKYNKNKLTVLPVLMSGRPYPDDREQRIRTRYAVVSALHRAGYSLEYPMRLSYAHVTVRVWVPPTVARERTYWCPVCKGGPGGVDNTVKRDLLVPAKLYTKGETDDGKSETNDHAVLVLWIDETQLGEKPLCALKQILHAICQWKCDRGNIRVRIIGPSDSGTLEKICEDNPHRDAFRDFAESIIYSPRATMSSETCWSQSDANSVELVRVIGTDALLARKIIEELGNRNPRLPGAATSRLVLIAEADSGYAQGLAEELRNESKCKSTLTLTYFRGIDGVAGDAEESDGAETSQREDVAESIHPRAWGQWQKDYLRRIENHLARQLKHGPDGGGGQQVAAIGVLGTEVHDKVLVVRALATHFPEATIFTTDLDSAYFQKENLPYTRNMLVASHFGLRLSNELQGSVPSFRDSYQTSTFLGTLMAIDCKEWERMKEVGADERQGIWTKEPGKVDKDEPLLHPLLFEIGNSGPYQLTQVGTFGNDSLTRKVQPESPREWKPDWRSWSRIVLATTAIAAIGASLTFCLWCQFRTVRNWLGALWDGLSVKLWVVNRGDDWAIRVIRGVVAMSLALLGVALAVLIFAHHYWDSQGEPFSLWEGISVWPSVLIRYLAIMLTCSFLLRVYFGLASLPRGWRKRPGSTDADARSAFRVTVTQEQVSIEHELTGSASWWRRCRYLLVPDLQFDRRLHSAAEVRQAYLARESPIRRFIRAGALTAAYFAFVIALFSLTQFPNSPVRGWASSLVYLFMLYPTIYLVLLLVFSVIDALQTCRAFVKRYTEHVTVESSLETIQVIAERTRVVGKLVFGPFIVILLMLASRLQVFDKTPFSLPLILVAGTVMGGLVFAYLALRVRAAKSREQVVGLLEGAVVESLDRGDEQRATEIRELKNAVCAEQEGAFRPWSRDFLLQAFCIPFGGTSILLLMEHLM